jgi:hypothetical protein
MKSNEILKALGVPLKGNSGEVKNLVIFHKLLVEVKSDIVGGEVLDFEDGKCHLWSVGYGRQFEEKILKVTIKNGCYKFPVPIDNDYFYSLCDLVGIPYSNTKVEITEFVRGVIVVPEILDDIKKAAKFISKDILKPQLGCVCLDFSGECVQVVATDAHRLYLSRKWDFEANDKSPFKLLISAESVKELCSVKVDEYEPLVIKVLDEETAYFNDIKVSLYDGYQKFPDYKAVLPNTESLQPVSFDANDFVKSVKQMIPSAMDKNMPIVTILSNGGGAYKNQLHISAESLDFDTDASTRLNCNCESSFDLEVSFNGKLLVESLACFKGQEIQMFAANETVFSFTNGIDNVLVSPCQHKPIMIDAPKQVAAKIETKLTKNNVFATNYAIGARVDFSEIKTGSIYKVFDTGKKYYMDVIVHDILSRCLFVEFSRDWSRHDSILINQIKSGEVLFYEAIPITQTIPTMYISNKGELKTKQNNFVTRLRKVAA